MSMLKTFTSASLLGLALVAPLTASAEKAPPAVPFQYGLGQQKFQAMCSECHGQWAEGTDKGPTLLHAYYRPAHHADEAFYRAATQGVKAHHWRFGDMPRVEGATREDIKPIIPFIRWLQRENGIQ